MHFGWQANRGGGLSPFPPRARAVTVNKIVLKQQVAPLLLRTRGVFRGGASGPWPPLWVARIAKLHRKVSKIEAWPPLQVGHQALGSKSPDFGQKLGRNLSEDLFFFCSSPDFGRKMGRNLSVTISNSDLCSFEIF